MRAQFMVRIFSIFVFILISNIYSGFAQVGIGTTNLLSGTSLQIEGANSGILINRVALSATDDTMTISGIDSSYEGLLVYNTNYSNNLNQSKDVSPGFYYWDGTQWKSVKDGGVRRTGWVALRDSDTSQVITGATSANITNNIGWEQLLMNFENNDGDVMLDAYAPEGYAATSFFNSTNHKLTPLSLGDSILMRFQCNAIPDNNNSYVVLRINIGTPASPIVIYQKTIPLLRGSGESNHISESILMYQLNTFVANGAIVEMAYSTTGGGQPGDVEIKDFDLVIDRLTSQ
ncbi:hypothetical protein [Constantimarinum furrinae]|uniref:Uncharacterized protein n=1 Tax=Constantimarinum furrinae TaxID=2562285 RepID=A0A7G8PS45_9FLAO|nr:hypothetical protein [Constantimarinum furrinae]QNJ97161.1 hypothetical protein ALE3EI_0583 [Constantimarinum furrinae]